MSITYDDIMKINNQMKKQKELWQKELFSYFKNADFDGGDKILISQSFAEIPDWTKDRIAVSRYVPADSYVIISGKKEERVRWAFERYGLTVLKNPMAMININGV